MEDVRIGDSDMRIPTRTREIYIGTPDRPRKDKRRGDLDDMDEDINKARRISLEFEEGDAMSIPGSRDDQPDIKLINMGNEIFVRMDENRCEGMVPMNDIPGDRFHFDADRFVVIGSRTKKEYNFGDKVRVRVYEVSTLKRQINLELVVD